MNTLFTYVLLKFTVPNCLCHCGFLTPKYLDHFVLQSFDFEGT